MTEQPDLRPALARTQDWVANLIDGVDESHHERTTPCSDWSVRDLLEHLLAVEHRAAVLPAQGSVDGEPVHIAFEGSPGEAFRAGVARVREAWADDAVLDQEMSPPWGTMPGRAVLGGYVQEHLVHGWDLAAATGQGGEVLADLAEQVLPVARETIPAAARSEDWMPFGEVVEPHPDAGPTEQLANWLGRTTR